MTQTSEDIVPQSREILQTFGWWWLGGFGWQFRSLHLNDHKILQLCGVISELKRRRFWATNVNRKWSFFHFLDGGFTQMFGQIASIIVKTLTNTKLVASRCFKMKKTSLPFDVRRSKTTLLKLLVNIYAGFRRVTFKLEVYKENLRCSFQQCRWIIR